MKDTTRMGLPRGCNLVVFGGLVCLDDPESYAGGRLVSW